MRMTRRRWILSSVAACAAIGFGLKVFLQQPNKIRAAPGPGWLSIDGFTKQEVKSHFPKFAAIQNAPDELLSGTNPVTDPELDPEKNPSRLEGFDVRSDSKFYDMTWWKMILPEEVQTSRLSPVQMTRVLEIRRKPGDARNKELRIPFWTHGFVVDAVKIKTTDRVSAASKPVLLNTGVLMKYFELTTDVGDHPEGEYFTLVIHAIFWNGTVNPESEDESTLTPASNINADIGVLLPHPHPMTVQYWSLLSGPRHQPRAADSTFKADQPPRDESGIIYWPIAHPEPDHVYTIKWNWTKESTQK